MINVLVAFLTLGFYQLPPEPSQPGFHTTVFRGSFLEDGMARERVAQNCMFGSQNHTYHTDGVRTYTEYKCYEPGGLK